MRVIYGFNITQHDFQCFLLPVIVTIERRFFGQVRLTERVPPPKSARYRLPCPRNLLQLKGLGLRCCAHGAVQCIVAVKGAHASECFHHMGLRRDPLARDHDLYAWSGEHLAACGGGGGEPSLSRPATGADITPAAIDNAERILAQHIGPMARILVRRSVPRAGSLPELLQSLADLIPDPAPRSAFLSSAFASSGLSGASSLARGVTSASTSAASATATGSGVIASADLERIEKLFARHMGPMAKVLVRRESRTANSVPTLCRALASHLDKDAERQRFLKDAGV